MGGLTCHLRVKALKSTVALPAVFLALCPVAAYADTVSVSGDPFTDPSATATAGPNSDFGNSASAYGVQPIPSVNMNNGGSATASATAEQSFSLPVFSPPVGADATAQGGDSAENTSGGGGDAHATSAAASLGYLVTSQATATGGYGSSISGAGPGGFGGDASSNATASAVGGGQAIAASSATGGGGFSGGAGGDATATAGEDPVYGSTTGEFDATVSSVGGAGGGAGQPMAVMAGRPPRA